MKKTVSVNIKGMNFMIEEDAYELLDQYMKRLELSLKGQKGSKDIIEDIELRIAELCQQFLNDKKQVIERSDIESIIKTLGEPEDFVEDDQEPTSQSIPEEPFHTQEKRLYRDIDNAKIAGVCAGLSNYFHVDVIVVRIIFFIFFFIGFGFPMYIILWLVIPKTASTIDRLRMHGKPITVDSVKDEIEQAAERVKTSSKSFANKIRNEQRNNKRLSQIGRIISLVFGIGMIGAGLFFLVIFIVLFMAGLRFIPIQSENGFLSISDMLSLTLNNSSDQFMAWTGIILVGFSVILFLLSNGTFILMKLKSKWRKIASLSLITTGIVGFVICVIIGLRTGREMSTEEGLERPVLNIDTPELVILPAEEENAKMGDFTVKTNGEFMDTRISKHYIYNYGIHFLYRESKDDLYHVYQNLSAHSHSYRDALKKAGNIHHQISCDSNQVHVSTEYYYPKKDKFRDQEVYIIIEVPKGKWVRIADERIGMDAVSKSWEPEDFPREKEGFLDRSGEYERWD